ncbi:MAG: Hsp70 family protein [Pseudanabaenaceae cyanobacterium]
MVPPFFLDMDYALDFGTSNTIVACQNGEGQVRTVVAIPSLVYVADAAKGEVQIGVEVADQPQRMFRNFKRAIGSEIEGFVPELDGVEVTAKQVGIWFLQGVIAHIKGAERLILTVPVASFESYRQWLLDNVEQLSVPEVHIIDEATAAALGYGITEGEQTILVIDWGGGTVDLAVVRLNLNKLQEKSSFLNSFLKWADRRTYSSGKVQPTAKVLAKTGQNFGGMDIDYWIVNYLVRTQALPRTIVTKTIAEDLKIQLSTQEKATVTVGEHLISLERSQLTEILEQNQFFQRLEKCLNNLQLQLQRVQLNLHNLDGVLLVGGTSQLPQLRTWLSNYFADVPVKSEKPFEAIAHGALAADWELEDFLYHSYGIRYWDRRNKCHNWHRIFSEGQVYPTKKNYELLLGASLPNQPQIELVIGELETTDTEVVYENEQLIVKALLERIVKAHPLNDTDTGRTIAKLDPLGQVGVDRIKVEFRIDRQRTLVITVTDLLTKKVLLQNQPVIKLQ